MRVVSFLSCLLTAQAYVLSPLSYPGLRFLPVPVLRAFRLQTPEPVPEPVVISLDDFDCPAPGIFADEESGCEQYWVCNEAVVRAPFLLIHPLFIIIIYQRFTRKAFHYTCNPGQLFDASLGACNEASAVDDYCNMNAQDEPAAPETSPIVLELPEDSVKFTCPGDGAYAHQESGCEKYFVCNGGRVNSRK